MFDIVTASTTTRILMDTFGIPVRPVDPRATPTPRISPGLPDSKPAEFVAGPDFFTEPYDSSKKLVTGYAHPIIRLSNDAHRILFEMKNALTRKYYESIIVHELVHFWEVRFVDVNTNRDEYVFQSDDLDAYMNQPSELNAYFIQALYYFDISNKADFTGDQKQVINKLFTAERVKYLYR